MSSSSASSSSSVRADSAMRRVAVVTGTTGAIGAAIARSLASQPHTTLILPVRSVAKGESLRSSLLSSLPSADVHLESVDLSDPSSIRALCHRLTSRYPRIHCLVNNASVCTRKREETPHGLEMQFAVNAFAYFLLMRGLHPALAAASTPQRLSRVVNVASDYAGVLDLDDLQSSRGRYDLDRAYRQSKQADRALSWHAAALYAKDGIAVNACQPGEVDSQLNRNLGYQGFESAEQGAATPVWLATAEELEGVTGKYYSYQRETPCPSQKDKAAQKRLWDICEQLEKKTMAKE